MTDACATFAGRLEMWPVAPLDDTPAAAAEMCRSAGADAMLNIQTFDNRAGGNVLYKALTHPLAAEAIAWLYARMRGPVALYDPEGIAAPLLALYPISLTALYVHDVAAVGVDRAGYVARPLTELPQSDARTVLIAAFDAGRIASRIAHLLPKSAELVSLDKVKLPDALLTNRARYLDKLNFATNFAFFRDANGLSTRLVSANYWSGYGGGGIRLWLRLFDETGNALATWEQEVELGSVRLLGREPQCARTLRPSTVHRTVVRACDRCGRARRGEIRAGHLSQVITAQVCRARMTPTPGRPTVMQACPRRARMSG